ncbi:MAG: hypothetical protein K6A44_00265 [bacterium]|nr:hypothetical protein [bacterium]
MSKASDITLKKTAREAVGKLFYSLIGGAVTSRDAIKYFPRNVEDTSIKIAWHALFHYDADEEMRQQDFEYAQEQIKYMEFLASILSGGGELPQNILDEYEELYKDTVLPKRYNWWGNLRSVMRFLD